jgi:hypothetical protein
MMRAMLFGESAHSKLPISKIKMAMRYTALKEKYL